jgi:hypothetical protein
MLKALPYLIALVAVGLSIYSAYKWGYNDARADQLELTNEALAKSAQHIIDEQSKLQIIEDVINKDPDTSRIKSPVLMRTLVRLHNCEGKPKC